MLYSRIILGIIGALYGFFGVWAMWRPGDITAMTEVALTTPTAVTDGRAVYGGLTLGLGVVFLLAALKVIDVRAGVLVLFLTLFFPVAGRVIGIPVDSGGTEATFKMMQGEVLFLLLSAAALYLEWRRAEGARA